MVSEVETSFFNPSQALVLIRRLPGVEFHCQGIQLPGISMAPVEQHNPFTPIRHAGDKVEFNELTVTFKVDGRLSNYRGIYDWMIGLGFPESHSQYGELAKRAAGMGLSSPLSVFFEDGKGRRFLEASFVDAFPVALSDVFVSTTTTDVRFATASVKFAYTLYGFLDVG